MKHSDEDKVLLAIYKEYKKDLPDMNKINAKVLGLESDVFKIALKKLRTEELITFESHTGGDGTIPLFIAKETIEIKPLGVKKARELEENHNENFNL